ncbi:MAG: hypothetical protein NZ845_02020, partial [Thermodesulfovibrio sp.]|nr:hypothetical protein [Thermodesulfovibrio sp.]
IDADIIYTEICPLDSLVQRMGRVLRRYFYIGDGKIIDKSNEEEININGEIKLFGETTNVYLLVFKKGYESGKGRVYHRELIEKSIKLLRKLQKSELSEYTKYEIVKKLYDELSKEGDYLRDFYQTLDILDAGYMSEKKKEALKIFREIYTVPAVPSSRIDEFKDSIETFLNEDHCLNYTHFKKEIISEYVVNIDIRKYYFANSLNLKSLSYIAYELKTSDEEKVKKMKRWLSDVYIFEGVYDKKKGVIFSKNENKKFSGIIDI